MAWGVAAKPSYSEGVGGPRPHTSSSSGLTLPCRAVATGEEAAELPDDVNRSATPVAAADGTPVGAVAAGAAAAAGGEADGGAGGGDAARAARAEGLHGRAGALLGVETELRAEGLRGRAGSPPGIATELWGVVAALPSRISSMRFPAESEPLLPRLPGVKPLLARRLPGVPGIEAWRPTPRSPPPAALDTGVAARCGAAAWAPAAGLFLEAGVLGPTLLPKPRSARTSPPPEARSSSASSSSSLESPPNKSFKSKSPIAPQGANPLTCAGG